MDFLKNEDIIMKKLLIASLLLTSLSACSGGMGLNGLAMMPKAPTEGPPEYIAGWKDGCDTGKTAYSHSMLRTMHHVKVNGPMMYNANYNKGWAAGNNYCAYYISTYLAAGPIDKGFGDDLRDEDTWVADNKIALLSGWNFPFGSDNDNLNVRDAGFNPFGGDGHGTDPFMGNGVDVLTF
jgi:hypothetical protein